MSEKDFVAVSHAIEQIKEAVRICEKAGIGGVGVRFVEVGLGEIVDEVRKETEK